MLLLQEQASSWYINCVFRYRLVTQSRHKGVLWLIWALLVPPHTGAVAAIMQGVRLKRYKAQASGNS